MIFFSTLRIFSSSAVGLVHIDLDNGGKVILPPSVLAEISDMASGSPMMFSLSHPVTEVQTHCGVLEFSAEEGSVVAPSWVLEQIGAMSGDMVYIESICLPVGSYTRVKPLNPDFLDITDQRAVLENHLRSFSCLTTGDNVPILYNGRTYQLKVVETRPGDAICIVDCDLAVEFDLPPTQVSPPTTEVEPPTTVFSGLGHRLDGKVTPSLHSALSTPKGLPDYHWKFGTLIFFRDIQPSKPVERNGEFSPFSGSGRSLK